MRIGLLLPALLLFSACDDSGTERGAPVAEPSASSVAEARPEPPVADAGASAPESTPPKPVAKGKQKRAPEPAVAPRDMPLPPPSPERREDSTTVTDALADYGFPTHESLKHLCGRRLLEAGGGQLLWDAFSSSRTPGALTQAYEKRLGKRGQSSAKGGARWALPVGSSAPRRSLEVLPFSARGRHRACPATDGGAPNSVLIVTRRR